jgi:endonuclease/exonuclease/phosphatase (EEP) superfamily protein YafD
MRALERLLLVAAAAVIVAAVLPLGTRLWWGFGLAAHFRLQYAVAGLVLLVPLALRRRFAWCAALAGAVALGVPGLVAYPPIPLLPTPTIAPAAARDADGSARIRIVSANLFFLNRQPGRLAPIVSAAAPDVVVLEEFTPEALRELDELRRTYPHRLETPAEGPYGIALLSRYPLEDARSFTLGQTTAVEARIMAPDGVRFSIIGVHLRSPTSAQGAAERNRQLGLLAAERARITGPLVVIGDFNLSPFSPSYGNWLAHARLTDTRRHRMYLATWPAFLPILGIPIDHCFISEEFQLADLRRLAAFGSDHYPLLAELVLESRSDPLSVHR